MKMRFFTTLLTAATLLAPVSLLAEQAQDAATKRHAIETYGKLPLSFEAGESAARFQARSGNYTVSVGERESSVAVINAKSGKHQMLSFAFDNAGPAVRLEALEPQPGVTNYYLGRDARQWRLGVKSYGKLRARSVYPGVDVVYYGDHRRLEFDYVVAPKADPSAIALSFSGMDKLYKDANGDLVAEVGGQPVRFAKPYAYQKAAGDSKAVAADYELAAGGKVHLRLGDYDRNAELIIDPVVTYVTYLGGSSADVGNGIAVDSTGAAYVTGQTCSSGGFPSGQVISPNPSGLPFQGACDAFVTKYTPGGTGYDYTTVLGGLIPANATATGNGIALDSANQAYIVGTTNIEDLPLTPASPSLGSYQGGDSDVFIAILDKFGDLKRTSYLGGRNADAGYGIAVDQATNVIVVGQTCSQNFPGYNAFETKVEDCVAFVTKLDNNLDIGAVNPVLGASALSAPVPVGGKTFYFSEFFGGQPVAPYPTGGAWTPSTPYAAGAIVLDTQNPPNIEIAMNAGTSGLYVPTAAPPIPNWSTSKSGNTVDGSIIWENFGVPAIPPAAFTEAYGVALDPPGDVFVAGGTNTAALASTLWPCSYGANGAWILKVSGNTGNGKAAGGCIYEWTLESTPTDLTATIDTARAVAVDSSGQAYVTGTVSGTLGTTKNAYKSAINGGTDAFLLRVNQSGSAIDYSTYLGGSGNDEGLGVAVDGSFVPYVTGSTESADFPTINPLTNPNDGNPIPLSGTAGAFVAKFTPDGATLAFSAYLGGSGADQGNAIAVVNDPVTGPLGQTYVDMFIAGNTTSTDLLSTLLLPMCDGNYVAPQTTNAGNGDAFVTMIPGASIPTVTVMPGSLAFYNQNVGSPSPAQQILYTNTNSLSSVQINTIAFSSADNGTEFKQTPGSGTPPDCNNGSVVQPLASCQIMVSFTPAATPLLIGSLTISDDASGTAHSVNLRGEGAVPADNPSSTNLLFGNQAVGTTSAVPQSVTLTNTSTNGTLFISSIEITGANPGDFSYSESESCQPQIAPVLAPLGTCTISVNFTPAVLGPRSATLMIADNAPQSPRSIALSGTGTSVLSTVTTNPPTTPVTLSFPQQAMNVASAPQTVMVKNTDPTQTLVVSSIVTTGNFQVSTNTCTAPILPGASCTIQVVFDPVASGTRNGTLVISGNGTVMPATVVLTGQAGASACLESTPGQCAAMPLTISVPNTNLGATSPAQVVTLANQSSFAFNVQSIVISGAAAGEYLQTNNCGTSVSASGSCSINISFTPTATGNQNATITVTSDAAASPQSFNVVGVGSAPLVTLAPPMDSTLNFSNQPMNSASSAMTVTLTNSGSGPLNIPAGGITITGTAASDFSQTNTCGTQVAAQANCTINVTFTPLALYSRSATLNIADNAIPSPQTIALLGTGEPAQTPPAGSGTIALSPSTVAFGNQQVSTTSSAKAVTLTNSSSSSALAINNIVITGNSDFVIVSGNCPASPATLAANTSCSFSITITPSTAIAETATLTVTGGASNSPQQITLTGTGTEAAGGTSSSAPFSVTPSTTGVTVTQNNTAQYTLSIAPLNGFSSSVAFTCSGPVGSSCSVTPNPLVMDGTTTKTATLSVSTTGGNGTTANARFGAKPIFLALLPFSIMGMLLINKRRSYWLAFVLLLLCLLLGMVGCGSGGASSSSSSGLAPGTYQVVVTATPSTNSSQAQTMTMNLVVTQQ